jgi:hypothetical protein
LLAAALTAASVWAAAIIAIPPLQDQVTIANYNFDQALAEWGSASANFRDKKGVVENAQQALDLCIAKIKAPGECEKCENDTITADDSQNPGMCKKCQGGAVANDDSEDPGTCQKCQGGAVANDDSEDPGTCQTCEGGSVANDDSENPGTCQTCEGGAVVNDDSGSCDDGDSCTHNDYCSDGGCTGDEDISPVAPCD